MQNLALRSPRDLQALLAGPALKQILATEGSKAELMRLLERKKAAVQPFNADQRSALQTIHLALNEGGVFAAITGPADTGKTTVLDAALKARQSAGTVCVHIPRPDRISADAIAEIDNSIQSLRTAPSTSNRHVVLAIDNAHTMSDELLTLLNRLAKATMRDSAPQLLFVGRPEFWERIGAPAYEALMCRLAIRCTLTQACRVA